MPMTRHHQSRRCRYGAQRTWTTRSSLSEKRIFASNRSVVSLSTHTVGGGIHVCILSRQLSSWNASSCVVHRRSHIWILQSIWSHGIYAMLATETCEAHGGWAGGLYYVDLVDLAVFFYSRCMAQSIAIALQEYHVQSPTTTFPHFDPHVLMTQTHAHRVGQTTIYQLIWWQTKGKRKFVIWWLVLGVECVCWHWNAWPCAMLLLYCCYMLCMRSAGLWKNGLGKWIY